MSEITDTDDGGTIQSQFRAMQKFLREKLTDDRWSVIFEHSEPEDDTWVFAIGYRDRSPDGHFDRTEIQVHTTTHWSIPMVLVIDRGYRSSGQPKVSWSSGGVCKDASEWQVANAMRVIWNWAEGFLARHAMVTTASDSSATDPS